MKHPTVMIVMTLLAASAMGWAGTGEPDDQLWTELDVVAPLASNTTITGIGQLRLSETLSNPIFTALGADVNYQYDEWTVSAEAPRLTTVAVLLAFVVYRNFRALRCVAETRARLT
jgi:hypothetical protein